MANKKTVVQMYEEILAIEGLTTEQKAFLEKRIELTKKKNAKPENAKPTKAQLENEGIKTTILNALAEVGKPTTITNLLKVNGEIGQYSNQKVSALLTQLLAVNMVVRTEEKGKAYYSLPTEGEGE